MSRGGALWFAMVLLVLAGWAASCGDEAAEPPPVQPSGGGGSGDGGAPVGGSRPCSPGQLLVDEACVPAGLPTDGCPPGELLDDGDQCQPAGVPAALCGVGFESDGDYGCRPILPADPCPAGQMALPGETSCRDVAPCGTEPWDGIPVEANTQFVDGSYGGGDSDGTEPRPWITVQEAVDAAESGAIVAVAAGTYTGQIAIAGKAVRLWGRCPGLVILEGTGGYVLNVGADADGTEIRDLQITGHVGWAAVGIHESLDVLVHRIWLHDTDGARGLDLTGDHGPTSVTVTDSLIERTRAIAVMVWGITATIERTIVRDTQQSLNSGIGRGINVGLNSVSGNPSTAVVRQALVEGCTGVGIGTWGSELTVESTLIRDTLPLPGGSAAGMGLYVQRLGQAPATATVRGTVVEGSRGFGVLSYGADLDVEGTVVRDTLPTGDDQHWGWGVFAADGGEPEVGSQGTLRWCLVDSSTHVGVGMYDSSLVFEGVRVRATDPHALDSTGGQGILLVPFLDELPRPQLTLRGSVVESCFSEGLFVFGADLTVERSVVRDVAPEQASLERGAGLVLVNHETAGPMGATISATLVDGVVGSGLRLWGGELSIDRSVVRNVDPSVADEAYGEGIGIYRHSVFDQPATAALRGLLIEDVHSAGLLGVDADVTMDGSIIRSVSSRAADGLLGDAVMIMVREASAQLRILDSWLEAASRAGLSSFGAHAELGYSLLECNPIDLNGEQLGDAAPSFDDLGGNACSCDGATHPCTMLSSGLAPPDALPDPDDAIERPDAGM